MKISAAAKLNDQDSTIFRQVINNKSDIALEAGFSRVVNVDNKSLEIALITDKTIELNKLKEVTSPVDYDRNLFNNDGLFSTTIFGNTTEERMKTHAYINLGRKFFHPYIFETLCDVQKNIKKVSSGEGAWFIDKDGSLIEILDINDSRYNEENTGLEWLITNYRKIKFKENESIERRERLKLINALSDEEMFISKYVVIPVFYRDIDISSGRKSVPEINNSYRKLISLSKTIRFSGGDYYSNKAMFNIQMELVKIRKFGQSLIEKKKGALQQTVLGKSIDYGARAVISVGVLNGMDKPNDMIVDILHTGIPVAKCLELGYPLIIKWIQEFFEKEFANKRKMNIYRKGPDGKPVLESIEIENQLDIFTVDYIDKKINKFIHHYGGRFEPVKIRCKNGKDVNMIFTGRGYSTAKDSALSATISTRPMTWMDIFYLAAVETLSDKYVYITRYPVLDYFGTFPTRISVLSTNKTMPVMINGKVYPHYPIIDSSLPEDKVVTMCIDTVSISNLYLDAIGGDYDGDMCSFKVCYTEEANQEAEQMLHSLKHYISLKGSLVRKIGNEAYLTFYNMTRKK